MTDYFQMSAKNRANARRRETRRANAERIFEDDRGKVVGTPFTQKQLAACARAFDRKRKADAAMSKLVHRLSRSHGMLHSQACWIGGIFAGGPASFDGTWPCPCGFPASGVFPLPVGGAR